MRFENSIRKVAPKTRRQALAAGGGAAAIGAAGLFMLSRSDDSRSTAAYSEDGEIVDIGEGYVLVDGWVLRASEVRSETE